MVYRIGIWRGKREHAVMSRNILQRAGTYCRLEKPEKKKGISRMSVMMSTFPGADCAGQCSFLLNTLKLRNSTSTDIARKR